MSLLVRGTIWPSPASLFEVVKRIFEPSPVLPFGLFCVDTHCQFCRFVDAFSREAEAVPPKLSPLITLTFGTPVLSVRRAGAERANEGSGESKTRPNFRIPCTTQKGGAGHEAGFSRQRRRPNGRYCGDARQGPPR